MSPQLSPQATHALFTAVIVALIAWRFYARVRRNIGRQRFSPRRPWFSVVFFPVLVLLLALSARQHPLLLEALAGGLVVGVALGIFGLRLTRFENTTEGLFYTPSAHLGIALSTLLACRIVYRFVAGGIPGAGSGQAGPPPLTPLTLLLVGALAGYYATYAAGLLRWSLQVRGLPPVPAAPAPAPAQSRGSTGP
jgi:hypothetical protein